MGQAAQPSHKGREQHCELLHSVRKGSHKQAQMVASHCQRVGARSLRGDLEEIETWRPDPASLAAGPCSLLLDGSACLLEAWGQVGIRTGSCKDRRIICCVTGPHARRRLLCKEDKPFPGSPPGLDAKTNRQGQEITFAVCLLPCAFWLSPGTNCPMPQFLHLLLFMSLSWEFLFGTFRENTELSPSRSIFLDK